MGERGTSAKGRWGLGKSKSRGSFDAERDEEGVYGPRGVEGERVDVDEVGVVELDRFGFECWKEGDVENVGDTGDAGTVGRDGNPFESWRRARAAPNGLRIAFSSSDSSG